MIIDAHAHLFGDRVELSAKDLLESMDEAEIDKSAIFAAINGPTNEQTIRIAQKYPERFFAVGFASPYRTETMVEYVTKLLEEGKIRALKFYLGYEYFYPNDLGLLSRYFEVLQKTGFPAIFHTGDTYPKFKGAKIKFAHPLAIDDVAVEFPKLKIIIAHMGNPWMTDAAAVIYKNKNVYADISGLVYGEFKPTEAAYLGDRLVKEVRPYLGNLEKLLFGSDFPIATQKSYVAFCRDLLCTLSEKERECVFHKNAEKLFRI